MNEHHHQQHEQQNHHTQLGGQQSPMTGFDHNLETRITRVLHDHAQHIHMTPALRRRFLQHLPTHAAHKERKKRLVSLTALVAAVFVLTCGLYSLHFLFPPHPIGSVLAYSTSTTLLTPSQLAQGGTLVSLDPTGQHLVYEPANQPGVMYVTDIAHPVTHNVLTMRNAYSVAWSPDGSALVTTVYSDKTNEPLLALASIGQYMHPLQKNVLAASWSPTSAQEITFVSGGQQRSQPQLWTISPTGTSSHLLATMSIPLLIQGMYWSPDGHTLAMLATTASVPSQQALEGPGRALYLMNAHSGAIEQVIAPGDFTLSNLTWSPNSRALLYVQQNLQNGQETTSLRALDVSTQRTLFTLPVQHLRGFSWSPQSSALIYSENGILHTYTTGNTPITLPTLSDLADYPIWLPDGRILYLHIHNGLGQLALLLPNTHF